MCTFCDHVSLLLFQYLRKLSVWRREVGQQSKPPYSTILYLSRRCCRRNSQKLLLNLPPRRLWSLLFVLACFWCSQMAACLINETVTLTACSCAFSSPVGISQTLTGRACLVQHTVSPPKRSLTKLITVRNVEKILSVLKP